MAEVQRFFGLVQQWLMLFAGLVLAVLLVLYLLRTLGVVMPVRSLAGLELVYACGAYWLLRGGKL